MGDALPSLFFLVWAGVLAAYAAARKRFRSRGVFHALSAANVLLAAPPAALIALLLCGGSPVAQLSGSSGAWHFWFSVWPLLVLAAFCALVVIGVGLLYHLVVNLIVKRRKEYGLFLLYLVPTLLNGWLTVVLLREAAPDA